MATGNSRARTLRQQHPSEYNSWKCMRARCYNPRNPSYKYHGAKGITVCERWRNDFAAFLADMGQKPAPDYTLERIDNDGDYQPENVRWATDAEQQRNTSKCRWLTFDGRTLCLADWAAETGLPHSTITARLDRFGWSVEKTLTTPPKITGPGKGRIVEFRGEHRRVIDLIREAGLSPWLVNDRLQDGWTLEEALTVPVRPKRPAKSKVPALKTKEAGSMIASADATNI